MRMRSWLAILLLVLEGCAHIETPPPAARAALAPSGQLRVGLLLGDATQALKDSSGAMKGVGYELGKDLAHQLGVSFKPVLYHSIGALLDQGKAGDWDIAFIGFTAERAKEWDFAPPHVEVEFGYLVPPRSSIVTLEGIDHPGVRVAVQQRSGPDAFLSRAIKHATIVRTPDYNAALQLQKEGKADAIFSIKPILFELSGKEPGSRVLDERPGVVPQALAMRKGRDPAGIAYAREFMEQAKAAGRVRAAIEASDLHGVVVAPVAQFVGSVGDPPILILVRHADKASEPAADPALTAAGAKRAQDLAQVLRDAGVTAIITTQLRRTRETAEPLARAVGITPEVMKVGERALVPNPAPGMHFPPEVTRERADYVKSLEARVHTLSGVVLIVGHDWSVPGLIAALGGPQLPNICASVYDNLFVLTAEDGKARLIQARYGAPTPDCK